MSEEVQLLGGRFDRQRVTLTATPVHLTLAGLTYTRLDDPDTGEFLGAYVKVD